MLEFHYDDIMNMSYPNPEIEKDFPDKILRAAQFAPFAALNGYGEAVEETARLTDKKIELDEYQKAELNAKLTMIANSDSIEPITITYFVADMLKSGGAYISKTGVVDEIRDYDKQVIMDDGTVIPVENIISIEGKAFDGLFDM